MRIYKDKQFLVFDFEDGKNVKYDFATKMAIGKKGKPVADLRSQLSGLTINELIDCCEDVQYGKFLKFVKAHGSYNSRNIRNIGTILNKVPTFARFEQIFSAGIEDIVDSRFSYSINDIPKALIKVCKTHKIILSNLFLEFYRHNPDGYLLAYNLEYISLTDKDIKDILSSYNSEWDRETRSYDYFSRFNVLIDEYGYTAKALMNYIDYCKTYEAIDYVFIYPKTTQDIKDEAVSQNNCVASYIRKVINGECHILFLRKKDDPTKSLVTIEVQDNKIVQARQRFNDPVTSEQQLIIDKWNDWYLKSGNKNMPSVPKKES